MISATSASDSATSLSLGARPNTRPVLTWKCARRRDWVLKGASTAVSRLRHLLVAGLLPQHPPRAHLQMRQKKRS